MIHSFTFFWDGQVAFSPFSQHRSVAVPLDDRVYDG